MSHEQLYASFLLDRENGLEIALKAEVVSEATPLLSPVKPLPSCIDYVEGFMQLREEVIPLVNLKKRLGLAETGYGLDAKVAVVDLYQRRYGLIFDDIREVFGTLDNNVEKMDGALQGDDKIIGAYIKLEQGRRVVEVLDLNSLFRGYTVELDKVEQSLKSERGERRETTYLRYIVFKFSGQYYGMPISFAQEITFFDAVERVGQVASQQGEKLPYSASIKDIFQHGDIDGILTLRGMIVPVVNSGRLLAGTGLKNDDTLGEDARVLVLSNGECNLGMVVEEVKAIEMVPEDRILPMMTGTDDSVTGVYQKPGGENIILLNPEGLVCDRLEELKAMARLSRENEKVEKQNRASTLDSHHLITENSYLVFSIGRNLAVQLKDVQEIIEDMDVLTLPGAKGFCRGIINLRGLVVPVVNVASFIGEEKEASGTGPQKLIICKVGKSTVALEVDAIVTIFKQEQYQSAGSVKPKLTEIADTLDRLIIFSNGSNRNEHVLVLNVHNLVRNHMEFKNF